MGWIWHGKCTSQAKLTGKTAVVTGGNSGIGYYTVLDFYKRGARVILACNDTENAICAKKSIMALCENENDTGSGEIIIKYLDLSSMKSVRQCAQQLIQEEEFIHILVNNAGTAVPTRQVSEDGYELQLATNHLGHFLLTLLLLPTLLHSAPASRIIVVASTQHCIANKIDFKDINMENSYTIFNAYNQTKLAVMLFASELARRLEGTGVTVYSVHPGAVNTNIIQVFAASISPTVQWLFNLCGYLVMKTPQQGAQTTIFCAVDETTANQNGLYYDDCKVATPPKAAQDVEMARKLWDVSAKMVCLGSFDPFNKHKIP